MQVGRRDRDGEEQAHGGSAQRGVGGRAARRGDDALEVSEQPFKDLVRRLKAAQELKHLGHRVMERATADAEEDARERLHRVRLYVGRMFFGEARAAFGEDLADRWLALRQLGRRAGADVVLQPHRVHLQVEEITVAHSVAFPERLVFAHDLLLEREAVVERVLINRNRHLRHGFACKDRFFRGHSTHKSYIR